MTSVIVFGPTGNVGTVAAVTAHEQGAQVHLAMRDPQKTISGLSLEDEKAGNYDRVQADLLDPASVTAAVEKTGAKRAFIYCMFQDRTGMRETISALKSAGIEFVVFLSSSSVEIREDPADIPPEEIIPYAHAQIEVNLREIFGPTGYVAVRPGAFATNILRYKDGINEGRVNLLGKIKFDWITFEDMGLVCGNLLAKGPSVLDGKTAFTLYGPQKLTNEESVNIIAGILGKDLKIGQATRDEEITDMTKIGIPRPVAQYVIDLTLNQNHDRPMGMDEGSEGFETGVANVQKYGGRPAMKFEDWVRSNRALFE